MKVVYIYSDEMKIWKTFFHRSGHSQVTKKCRTIFAKFLWNLFFPRWWLPAAILKLCRNRKRASFTHASIVSRCKCSWRSDERKLWPAQKLKENVYPQQQQQQNNKQQQNEWILGHQWPGVIIFEVIITYSNTLT